MIAAGAEDARQDLELRRRYLSGELRDPTLESVFGSDIDGGLELGARPPNANGGPGAPADIVDSGLAQFLGRRLQEDQGNSRLPSLQNPNLMTHLGPGLGNATMRGATSIQPDQNSRPSSVTCSGHQPIHGWCMGWVEVAPSSALA